MQSGYFTQSDIEDKEDGRLLSARENEDDAYLLDADNLCESEHDDLIEYDNFDESDDGDNDNEREEEREEVERKEKQRRRRKARRWNARRRNARKRNARSWNARRRNARRRNARRRNTRRTMKKGKFRNRKVNGKNCVLSAITVVIKMELTERTKKRILKEIQAKVIYKS